MIKDRFRSESIKKYMIVLIVIFIVCSVLTALFFFRAVNSISIESDLYQKIKSSSTLKADIFPPTLYIVEADLLVQQVMSESNAEKRMVLLQKMEQSRVQYFTYYSYWKKNITDKTLSSLLDSSDVYVREFYKIYDDKFLPALFNNNIQAMQEIADTEMSPVFEKHREIIDKMSGIIEVSKTATEKDAKDYADRATIILLGVYILSIAIILAISMVVLRKVSVIEKDIVSSQHETEMANARLESIVEGLKKFKHSYDNTLASIEGYALRDDMPGLKAYLEEIIAEKSKNEAVNYFKLNFIDNPAITGLIISKMIYAEKLDVQFVLKVRTNAAGIAIKLSHLCEILGILLDNAIEAAAESGGKKISLKMEESEEAFAFEISNSTDAAPNQSRMWEKGWTTKDESHGYGLWMANELIAKYDNAVLNTTVEQHSFTQELIVLKRPSSLKETLFTDIL